MGMFSALFTALVSATLSAVAAGQTIRVTVGDGTTEHQVATYASNAAIVLTTSQIAQAALDQFGNPCYSCDFLRIYDTSTDNNGTATLSVGPVTIRVDTPSNQRPSSLRVQVAPISHPDFNQFALPEDFMPSGALSFRSIVVDATQTIIDQDPTVIEDFKRGIHLAIAIRGDLGQLPQGTNPRDRVEVGSVFRVQVGRAPGSSTVGGNVHADIRAIAADYLAPGVSAIANLIAANSITGSPSPSQAGTTRLPPLSHTRAASASSSLVPLPTPTAPASPATSSPKPARSTKSSAQHQSAPPLAR